jgi:acyl-coenzyme A synthetase/AMP-(fatty) acid ligase
MRVSAEAVETQFSQHPAIRNVAVVGVSERV